MAAVASQPPVRTPSGGTTDQIFQPLADCGNGNPAFYHQYFDEFDQAFSFTTANTYTIVGTGTFAANAQDGGVGRLSALTASFEQIQVVTPSFAINKQPKKVFFEVGFTGMSTPALSTIVTGLINTNANFTGTTITDGVYFTYAGATNILTLTSAIGSVATTVTIPAAAYSLLTAATPFSLAFYITRLGDILAYVDTQLVGYIPQSNIGTTGNPQNAGAVARITGPTLTTALLTPSLGIAAAAGATRSIDVDYIDAQRER
jgi:hypothetical protein